MTEKKKPELIRAAIAILDAQEEREKSWDEDVQKYTVSAQECYKKHFKKQKISLALIELMKFGNWGDMNKWATDTLKSNGYL